MFQVFTVCHEVFSVFTHLLQHRYKAIRCCSGKHFARGWSIRRLVQTSVELVYASIRCGTRRGVLVSCLVVPLHLQPQ